MILESYSWKQELTRHRRSLDVWAAKTHTSRGYCFIERGIFLSAFIARKLIENRKVTDRVRNRAIRCNSYRPFRALSDRVSRFHGVFDVEKEYDLAKPQVAQFSLFDLTSEIMHSYVFVPTVDEGDRLTSFFISSYKNRDDRVLSIEIGSYLKAIDVVIGDDVQSIRVWKDPGNGRVYAEHN